MPTVKLTNQTPLDFSSYQPQYSSFNFDMEAELKTKIFKQLSQAIFTPLHNQTPVQLTIDGQTKNMDDVAELLTNDVSRPDINVNENEQASLLIHQSSRYRSRQPQNWKNVIANSILLKDKQPLPSPSLIYTYDTDIQNQAKDVLVNDTPDNRQKLLIGLLGNLLSNPINHSWCFILTTNQDYQNIKNNLNDNIKLYNQDPQNNKFNQDVQTIDLDSGNNFTSWITGQNNNKNSFNRFIMYTLDQYQSNSVHMTLPLNIQTLLNPVGFSFINIETLANSTQHEYNQELKQLQQITNKLVGFKYLKLTKIKAANKIDPSQGTKQYTKSGNGTITQRKIQGFHKTLPSTQYQLNRMVKIVKKHISNLQSSNTYRNHRYTFMRPNRRHPNNMNLRGRIQQIKYRPDIHIYLDSSGSISEDQYKTAIILLIKIAKKLKTDLYFTSFSDSISQPFKLITKNATVKQIYRQIHNLPKVGGGTEYEQVWNMIDAIDQQNHRGHKAPRLNFMITDFCYEIRSSYTPQIRKASTKDTYYLPLAANQNEYDEIYNWAMDFANSLIDKNDLKIKSRMIM